MSCNWKNKQLGEIVSLQRGHDLPSHERKNGNIPILGSSGITGYHNTAKAKGPGVVIGRSGNSMGEVSFTYNDYWPLNTCLYVTDFKGNDELFIYYLLKTIRFDQFNSGSAQKSLNRNAVYPYEVLFTDCKEEQVRIGKVLAGIENKLAVNNQINQTLEQMAQALFKSWFVDFEPVKAKMAVREAGGSAEQANLAAMQVISGAVQGCTNVASAGRAGATKTETQLEAMQTKQPEQYAELKATAELFPDAMQASEFGVVPEGWEIVKIESMLELAYGKALKKTDRKQGNVPVYGSGGVNGYHNESLIKSPGIIVGRKGTVGSVYWANTPFFPIDTVFYVKPKQSISYEFLYYLLLTLGLEGMNTDAAVPGLNRNNVYRLEIPNFPKELIERFAKFSTTIKALINKNLSNTQTLTELRDILLPKLLSGELAIDAISAKEASK